MADLSIHELLEKGRIIPARTRNSTYECLRHLVKVMEYATNTETFDSLRSALNRVACREDEPVYLHADTGYDFWWCLITPAEAQYIINDPDHHVKLQGRYHGGIVGHTRYKDGEPTEGKDWTIHT